MRRLAVVILLGLVAPLRAQTALPAVDDVEWEPFRDHCLTVLRALDDAKSSLPNAAAIRELLERKQSNLDDLILEVQKRFDEYCLLGVNINPESRVKAARGPASAELVRGRERIVLVRVHNEGGVTSALAVSGLGVVEDGKRDPEAWLEAKPLTAKPLSGRRLEYVPVRLTAREDGKREATLRFDVGQGTQDLGFRAEVPILFVVKMP